jgi:methyltransferase
MFLFVITFLILQRLAELILSKRNEIWLRGKGAVEHGRDHYPWMVALHVTFILSLFVEFVLRYQTQNIFISIPYSTFFFLAWILILFVKLWVLASLGRYWNTRVLRVPDEVLVNRGPYKILKHPNYIMVVLEIFVIPMIFGFLYTAIIFSILNFIMLAIRIRVENKALDG